MEDDEGDEQGFGVSHRLERQIHIGMEDPGELRSGEKLRPNLSVLLGKDKEVGNAARARIPAERRGGESKAGYDSNRFQKVEAAARKRMSNMKQEFHPAILPCRPTETLNVIRDVGLGENQGLAWNPDNPLVRAAAYRRREVPSRLVGDINSDHREISVGHFKNIRTTSTCHGPLTVRVRVFPEATFEHGCTVPIGTYRVNRIVRYPLLVALDRPEIVCTAAVRLLREKREALGLSMSAVAAKAGLSHTMVSRVERGLRKPTLDTVIRMAGAMNIEFWPLLKSAESTAPIPKTE